MKPIWEMPLPVDMHAMWEMLPIDMHTAYEKWVKTVTTKGDRVIERDMDEPRSKGVQSEREVKEGGLDKRYYQRTYTDSGKGYATLDRHPLSQQFHDVCDSMKTMHDKKQQDYGRANNPFSNVSASEEWGLEPWVGAMVRATDKLRRLQVAATRGSLANEGVEDSLIDLAVYSVIALVLYRNRQMTATKVASKQPQQLDRYGEPAWTALTPETVLKRLREMDVESQGG